MIQNDRNVRDSEGEVQMAISMRDAKRLYVYGNDRGFGYAPYRDVPGPDTIEAAVSAAEADGWTLLLSRHTSDDIAVLSDAEGALLGIGGDAQGNGAWAVVLSEQIEPLAALDASLENFGHAETVQS